MLYTEDEVHGTPTSLLDSLERLDESSSTIEMVNVRENSRLGKWIIDLNEAYKFVQENGIDFDEVVLEISNVHGIDPNDIGFMTDYDSIVANEDIQYLVTEMNQKDIPVYIKNADSIEFSQFVDEAIEDYLNDDPTKMHAIQEFSLGKAHDTAMEKSKARIMAQQGSNFLQSGVNAAFRGAVRGANAGATDIINNRLFGAINGREVRQPDGSTRRENGWAYNTAARYGGHDAGHFARSMTRGATRGVSNFLVNKVQHGIGLTDERLNNYNAQTNIRNSLGTIKNKIKVLLSRLGMTRDPQEREKLNNAIYELKQANGIVG